MPLALFEIGDPSGLLPYVLAGGDLYVFAADVARDHDCCAGLIARVFAGPAAAANTSQPIPCDDIDSVGRAKMSADGTITLQLRSLWPNPIAETQLVYAPDDPQYEEIKHHLGGINPGESKPVPPFCGLNSEP